MDSGAAWRTDVSPTDNTVPIDAEQTIASPRFDEKSVQRARPAEPLAPRARARARSSWPLAIIVACVLAGLAGGMLGGIALMKYQGSKSKTETPTDEAQAKSDQQPVNSQTSAASQTSSDGTAASNATATPDSARLPASDEGDEGADGSKAEGVESARSSGAELRSALDGWIAATNARDVEKQMEFYAPNVEAFYLSRNASRAAVREEKSRLFSQARAVDVRASEPEIRLSRDGSKAVMRFRKRYQIDERGGEVLQELRWRRTPSGWRIVGERDLRVIQ